MIIVSKKIFKDGKRSFSFLGNFFVKETSKERTKFSILGYRIFSKKTPNKYAALLKPLNDLKEEVAILKKDIVNIFQLQFSAFKINGEAFTEFKNINKGKDVVLVGAGPSLNYFSSSFLSNGVYCGLNRSFLYKQIKFNYLFINDIASLITDNLQEYLLTYEEKCIKFVGELNGIKGWQISHSFINKLKNARPYKLTCGILPSNFVADIDINPLGSFTTVSLPAMQFLLFTNPKRIYLVGNKKKNNGHFSGSTFNEASRGNAPLDKLFNQSVEDWCSLKKFLEIFYPDIEIISVNPVGLRGLFKDVYTQRYLDANPQLKEELGENIEILSEDNN